MINEPKPGYLCPIGYKQTEVGVIPEDWEVVPMGSLGIFSKGQGIRKDEATSGDIPCVRYGEIYTYHNDHVRSFNSFISAHVAKTSKRLKKGDVLFAGSGETKEEIGKCVSFTKDIEAYAGGDIVILSPLKVHSLFLGYLFNAPITVRQKASKGQGDAVVHISATALSSIKVPLPPTKAEQEAIAEALSDADALIESLEQLITKKRHIKQGAMQELLTGRKRLPGFSGEWEVKRLEEVANIDFDSLSSTTLPNYNFNYISLEDVDFGSLRSYSEQVFCTAPSRARRRLKSGDILISTVRPNLQSHLLFTSNETNWICSTGFSVVRCKVLDANPNYIYSHFFGHLVAKQIEALITGSNYPAINGKDIKALEIPMPKLTEQTAIATILSDMDAEIAALETKLTKIQALKQGMMHNLLTGRIRLLGQTMAVDLSQ